MRLDSRLEISFRYSPNLRLRLFRNFCYFERARAIQTLRCCIVHCFLQQVRPFIEQSPFFFLISFVCESSFGKVKFFLLLNSTSLYQRFYRGQQITGYPELSVSLLWSLIPVTEFIIYRFDYCVYNIQNTTKISTSVLLKPSLFPCRYCETIESNLRTIG